LDPALAGTLAERHRAYAADYSYADGWPYGFAPELLAPGTAGILAKILGEEDGGSMERDAVFQVLQKDINSFDIETEISPADLRQHRLCLAADSKRNLLLLTQLIAGGLKDAAGASMVIRERPGLLRTLPNFFAIQAASPCPRDCALCPWPALRSHAAGGDFMDTGAFLSLLDRIADFAGDAVIDLSLWGEIALHPEKLTLIRGILARPPLSLILETSGLNWTQGELEALASDAAQAPQRLNRMAPLSWIVSLDAVPGRGEAVSCAEKLLGLFPQDAYIQAIRLKGAEDDIELFYRTWKEKAPSPKNIIIQKYDDFCGVLPRLQATDLSPVRRRPCWHLLRDFNILLDGRVPACREDLGALSNTGEGDKPLWGNVFEDSLQEIWRRGEALYLEQCVPSYRGICAECDEYYIFNY
jgi:spiro-SPASM protein